jgi:hypothetical protein
MHKLVAAVAILLLLAAGAAAVVYERPQQIDSGGKSAPSPEQPDTSKKITMGNNASSASESYVVFSEDIRVGTSERRFTPTAAEAAQADQLFIEADPGLLEYYRQYYGVMNDGSQKEIHLRAVAKDLQEYAQTWKDAPLIVFDGGSDFIDGAVNIETGTVLFLEPHGGS